MIKIIKRKYKSKWWEKSISGRKKTMCEGSEVRKEPVLPKDLKKSTVKCSKQAESGWRDKHQLDHVGSLGPVKAFEF